VLAYVRNNEKFCFGVSVSVDRDKGGNSYSHHGIFARVLGGNYDWYGGDDGDDDGSLNARGGDGDGYHRG
jgi:hypothetical protein